MVTESLGAPIRRLVGVLSLTSITSFGILAYAFSVLLLPMERELGAGRAELSAAIAVGGVVRAAASPLVGMWVDRFGVRGLMTVGSILGVGAVLAWSTVTSVAQLVAVQAAIGLIGAAVFYEPGFAAIARATEGSSRVRATVTVTIVGGFASTVFLPLTSLLVDGFGWRSALRILALVLALLTVLPNLLLLRDIPSAEGRATSITPKRGLKGVKDIVRQRDFGRIALMLILGLLPAGLLIVHLPALVEERGESAFLAASVAGSIGILSVTGRVLLSVLMRRRPLLSILRALFLIQGIGLIVLLSSTSRAGLVVFVLAYGLGFGTLSIASPLLVSERFGREVFGTVAGLINAAVTVGMVLAPFIAGAMRSATGDYRMVLIFAASSSVLAGLVTRRLQTPVRTPRQDGEEHADVENRRAPLRG